MNEEKRVLNFKEFIPEFYPEYTIDEFNSSVIDSLVLWTARDAVFNDKEKGRHVDKGILLMGQVGTGKTDLFRLLKIYLNQYMKSPYSFSYGVVWKFTAEFNKSGYESLDDQEKGNRYYDELCLTNTRTGFPEKEQAMHYGSKLLIGEELIMLRYNSFKSCAYQTHFSTNATGAELKNCYGERAYSRLTEMCNFLPLIGNDRRGDGDTVFHNNANVKKEKPTTSGGVSEQDVQDNKNMLNKEYEKYLVTGDIDDMSVLYHALLKIYGCDLGNDEEMEALNQKISKLYFDQSPLLLKTPTEKEKEKINFVLRETKKAAVRNFYDRLREVGAKSIFGEVDIDMGQIIGLLVQENKQNQ